MTRYYMVCTQCKKRTEITEDKAKAYGTMRALAGGAAAGCVVCDGAVKGEIVPDKQIQGNDTPTHK